MFSEIAHRGNGRAWEPDRWASQRRSTSLHLFAHQQGSRDCRALRSLLAGAQEAAHLTLLTGLGARSLEGLRWERPVSAPQGWGPQRGGRRAADGWVAEGWSLLEGFSQIWKLLLPVSWDVSWAAERSPSAWTLAVAWASSQ